MSLSRERLSIRSGRPLPGQGEEIAIRYLGEEAGREFARSYDNTDTVLFTIKPDRWFTADFSGEL